MDKLGMILYGYVAPLGIIIISLYYIIEFFKNFDSFKILCVKLKKRISGIIHILNTRKRRSYDKVLASKDFLDFQNQVLGVIYDDEIKKANDFLGKELCTRTKMFNTEYEAVEIKFDHLIEYPFKGFLDKENGCEYNCNIKYKCDRKQKKYKKLIRRTVRKPKKIGYMLDNIDYINGKMTNYCGTFEQNLYTSHILEYEIYLLYKNKKKYKVSSLIENKEVNKLLALLPKRKLIHDKVGKERSVLLTGEGRYSLLGVQAMVMLKNQSNTYDVLRIRRGTDVSIKPGFIQFIPSGGFETFENKDDFDTKYANYSLNKAIFRELMEECFGIDEEPNNSHISSEHIYSYKPVSKVVELIKEGKAELSLLGTSISLVSLRNELSFVLKIDDSEFAKELSCNYESDGVISSIDIDVLLNEEYWSNYSKDSKNIDLYKLNNTSASLFNLVKAFGYFDKNK